MSLIFCDYLTYWWEHRIEKQIRETMTAVKAPQEAIAEFSKFTWREMWIKAEGERTLLGVSASYSFLYCSSQERLLTVVGTSDTVYNSEHKALQDALGKITANTQDLTLIGVLTTGNISRKSLSTANTQVLQNSPIVEPWTTIVHTGNSELYDSTNAQAEVCTLTEEIQQ